MASLYYNNTIQTFETVANRFQSDTSTGSEELPVSGNIRFTNIITPFSVFRDLLAIAGGIAISVIVLLWLQELWAASVVEGSATVNDKGLGFINGILSFVIVGILIGFVALISGILPRLALRKIPVRNTFDFDFFTNKIRYNFYFDTISVPFPNAVFIANEHTYTITTGKYEFKRVIQLLFDVNSSINVRELGEVDFKYRESDLWNRHKYYVIDEFDNEDDQGLHRLRTKWKYIVSFFPSADSML